MRDYEVTIENRKNTIPCVHGLSYNDTIKVWLESEAEEKR